ncbi:MAG: hypothetical protein ACREVI_14730, partial [Steroidobacteraceae bacterium]
MEQTVLIPTESGEIAWFRPDGKVAVLRSRSASIDSCSVTESLWAVDVSGLKPGANTGAPRLRKLGDWTSTTNESPLSELRWLPDQRSLAFLAPSDYGRRVLLKLDTDTG